MNKICNTCNKEFALEEFEKDSRNSDGRQGICKHCRKEAKLKRAKERREKGPEIVVEEKHCNKCSLIKPAAEFFKDSHSSDGLMRSCKPCKMGSALNWRANNKERYNETQRKYHKKNYERYRLNRYNITPEQWSNMLKQQDGKCKICGDLPPEGKDLVTDHNHKTGIVRGLLCYRCNREIVLLEKDETHILKAVEYIKNNGNI